MDQRNVKYSILIIVLVVMSILFYMQRVAKMEKELNDIKKEQKMKEPGAGAIMIEFGYRFSAAYYAAKESNWDLAKYELDELLEAQERIEAIRPVHKDKLKEFEDSHMLPLIESLDEKDFNVFKQNFTETMKACNKCHVESDHHFVKFKLPKHGPNFLEMKLQK